MFDSLTSYYTKIFAFLISDTAHVALNFGLVALSSIAVLRIYYLVFISDQNHREQVLRSSELKYRLILICALVCFIWLLKMPIVLKLIAYAMVAILAIILLFNLSPA